MMSDQIRNALQSANDRKARRYEIRQAVAGGRQTVAAALADPACATARVVEVLAWQRYWAEFKAERFLLVHHICSPFAVAGQLTDRQRALVAKALRTDDRQEAA